MIPDNEILEADPEEVLKEYNGVVINVAKKYEWALRKYSFIDMEDLFQAGRVGLLKAQKNYDPDKGYSFLSYSFLWVKSFIRRTIGIENNGEMEEPSLSFDAPISLTDPDSGTLADIIPDLSNPDIEEAYAEKEEREEIKRDMNEALNRLNNKRYEDIVKYHYYEGKTVAQIAKEWNEPYVKTRSSLNTALNKLRRDRRLWKYRKVYFVSLSEYRITHTSGVEKTILMDELRIDQQFGEGTYIKIGIDGELK